MIKNIREELWNIIEESKKGIQFRTAWQEDELRTILEERYSRENIDLLSDEFHKIQKEYIDSKDYDLLHWSNGGIVSGGDDCFYSDFTSWLVGQGKEVYEDYFKRGILAVLVYIIDNKIEQDDFQHECLEYAFLDYDKVEKDFNKLIEQNN
jgi:hypothetical protein